jgi:hypothetical protein
MASHWPYHQIRFNEPGGNNAGRCLDVTGVSQSAGAKLQLWDCLGESQDNQLWKGEGGGEYIEFLAKHSNQCMDVEGYSAANGARIQQWLCYGTTNQLWKFQSVG